MAAERDIQELTADDRDGQSGFTLHLPSFTNATEQRTKSGIRADAETLCCFRNVYVASLRLIQYPHKSNTFAQRKQRREVLLMKKYTNVQNPNMLRRVNYHSITENKLTIATIH